MGAKESPAAGYLQCRPALKATEQQDKVILGRHSYTSQRV